jgi:hypothetical protein
MNLYRSVLILNVLLLVSFLLIAQRGYGQYVRSVRSNVKTNGNVTSIIMKDCYTQKSGAVDTVIFTTIFNNKGECQSEDESRVYDSRYPGLVDSSYVKYRSSHTCYTYYYNSTGKISKVTWVRNSVKGVIYFDKKELPIKEVENSPEDDIEMRNRYDQNGNLTHRLNYSHNTFMIEDIFKYDNRSLEIESSQKNWYSYSTFYYNYQSFDTKGNWTKCICLDRNHKPINISLREIKYSD